MQDSTAIEISSRLLKRLTASLFVLFLIFPQVVLAQVGGQISGRVESDVGELLQNVQITITGPKNFRRNTIPDGKGYYRFIQLDDGVYNLESTADKHTTQRKEGIELRAGSTITINFRLLLEQATLRWVNQH